MASAVDAWSCAPHPSFSPRAGRLRARLGAADAAAGARDEGDPEADEADEAAETDGDEDDGDWRLVADWTACPIGYVMY